VSSPSNTRFAPWATRQMLGSYMPPVGSVGSSQRNSDKPGTAVV